MAGHCERKGPMESVAATVGIIGLNVECGKMRDGAVSIAGIVATIRSSRNDGARALGLREIGTCISGANRIACPACKVVWDDQMIDEFSQPEGGLGMTFDVSQDRDTQIAYLCRDLRQ